MSGEHEKIVRETLEQAVELTSRQTIGERMFAHFFERYPEAREIFAKTPVEDFATSKLKRVNDHVLDAICREKHAADKFFSEVFRHRYYDVYDAQYFYGMVEAYKDAVAQTLGEDWTPEMEAHWKEAVEAAKAAIQTAVREAETG